MRSDELAPGETTSLLSDASGAKYNGGSSSSASTPAPSGSSSPDRLENNNAVPQSLASPMTPQNSPPSHKSRPKPLLLPQAAKSANTLLRRLKSSRSRIRAREREWQDTHVDVFHSMSRLMPPPTPTHVKSRDHKDPKRSHKNITPTTLWRMLQTPLLVILIGILTALICVMVNITTKSVYPYRHSLVMPPERLGLPISTPLKLLIYVSCSVTLSCLANFVTQSLCPEAVGGGIPEVKTLLDGGYKKALVTPWTVMAKSLGLTLASAAGLSVGKEGPFVHIATAIADTLMRQRLFRHLASNDAKRLEVLACAAAAGVGTTFGTPFAAVMFSIEVTAGYFMVRNLPRTFLCAISGTLAMTFLGYNEAFALFSDLPKMASGYHARDLISFLLLGIVSGLLGCVFIVLVERAVKFRNLFLHHSNPTADQVGRRRYLYVALVTALVSPFIFLDMRMGVASFGDQHSIVNYMFQTKALGLSLPLLLYLPFKFIVTILCVTLPLPVGLFTPVFLIGGTTGRVVGEALRTLDTHFLEKHGIPDFITFHPWEFALIGAAAFSAGVTRAISTAIIILELSGEHHLRTPTGVAVLVAYFIGNRFTKNVYDLLVDTNGNPMLPTLPESLYRCTATEVMGSYETVERRFYNGTWHPSTEDFRANEMLLPPVISLDTTVREAIMTIGSGDYQLSDNVILPVVDGSNTMMLVGAVLVGDLRSSVASIATAASLMGGGTTSQRSNFFVIGKSGSKHELTSVDEDAGDDAEESNEEENFLESGNDILDQKLTFAVEANGAMIPVVREEVVRASPRVASPVKSPVGVAATSPGGRRILKTWVIPLDPAPYQIVHTMQLSKIDLVFRMLKLNQAYVTNNGKLVGMVNREMLRSFIGNREKHPSDKVWLLWLGFKSFFRRNEDDEDEDDDDDPSHDVMFVL